MRLLLQRLPSPIFPSGPLVAIIDGYQLFFEAQPWTVYLILLRPIGSSRATVTPACFLPGRETVRGWEEAFARIPDAVLSQIRAVVADGMLGIDRLARTRRWVLQRCHVHLLRILYPLLGNRFKRVKAKQLRQRAYTHVRTILTSDDDGAVQQSLVALRSVAYTPQCPRRFGLKLRGFLRSYHEFRSYLMYPELQLPATTNTAEMVCGKIAELMHRTRGFRTPRSFERWMILLLRMQPRFQCNGTVINRKTVS